MRLVRALDLALLMLGCVTDTSVTVAPSVVSTFE